MSWYNRHMETVVGPRVWCLHAFLGVPILGLQGWGDQSSACQLSLRFPWVRLSAQSQHDPGGGSDQPGWAQVGGTLTWLQGDARGSRVHPGCSMGTPHGNLAASGSFRLPLPGEDLLPRGTAGTSPIHPCSWSSRIKWLCSGQQEVTHGAQGQLPPVHTALCPVSPIIVL